MKSIVLWIVFLGAAFWCGFGLASVIAASRMADEKMERIMRDKHA